MTYIWAGILAAGLAWAVNTQAVKRWGDRYIVWLVPWLEEGLKSGLALLGNTSLPLTHGVFGLTEAIHDYLVSKRWGLWAGLTSVVSHWFFGQITLYAHNFTNSWPLSIGLAALIHSLWNIFMIRLFAFLAARKVP